MFQYNEIESILIKILNENHEPVGAGFVISPTLAVTCAHVIEAAHSKAGSSIEIEFYVNQVRQTVKIVTDGYSPKDTDDIAFLQLIELPEKVKVAKIGSAYGHMGQDYAVIGFPKGQYQAYYAQGKLAEPIRPNETKRFSVIQFQGNEIFQGMSGGPVYLLELKQVIGMVSEFTNQEYVRTAYATTIETILKLRPDQSISHPEDLITSLLHGIDELPERPDTKIRNFLEYYLGTSQTPSPFGGRDADLKIMDTWLEDDQAPPYACLVAPAGRGKSSFLVHWIKQLYQKENCPHIVYFPISIRYKTNLENQCFFSLAARLAHINREIISTTRTTDQAQGMYLEYLRRYPLDGKIILVILDGLDEAAGWSPGTDLFPSSPPAHLRAIVAARPLAGKKGALVWLNRLGWVQPGYTRIFNLEGLNLTGVREVLQSMGSPLQQLIHHEDIIKQLYRLTKGDPLLVGLYTQALLEQKQSTPKLTPRDLLNLKPGLEAYIDNWFEEQQKLWGEQQPLKEQGVRSLLTLCAFAMGPLQINDIRELAPDVFKEGWQVDEAAKAVERFIIGDGMEEGYIFSHPRLGDNFQKIAGKDCSMWQKRFLDYGKRSVNALINGSLSEKEVSPYIVRYYWAHLSEGINPSEDIYVLMHRKWSDAWMWVEGTSIGFLNDVDHVWQQAEKDGTQAIVQIIRAALCRSSQMTISEKINNEILIAAVKAGLKSTTYARVIAKQKRKPKDKIDILIGIINLVPNSEKKATEIEALEITLATQDEEDRGSCLSALAPHLPPDLLSTALEAALAINDEYYRANALNGLAPHLPPDLLSTALEAALAIKGEYSRANALSSLAPHLPLEARSKVFSSALEAALAIHDEDSRVNVLISLTPHLPPDLLPSALDAALAILDEDSRANVLISLTPHLPPDLLPSALGAALAIHDEDSRAGTLSRLAPQMPTNLLPSILVAALAIRDEDSRANALISLAPYLSPDLLNSTLEVALSIQNEYSRAFALNGLAPYLPPEIRSKALSSAIEAALAIQSINSRVYTFSDLAPHLPSDLRSKALSSAINAIVAFHNEDSLASTLTNLAPQLPPNLLSIALEVALAIHDKDSRANALSGLAPHLSPDLLFIVLEADLAIHDEYYRTSVINSLAPHLPPEVRLKVLSSALEIALTIHNEYSRADALSILAPHLSTDLLSTALEAALAIHDEDSRANILISLAPHLSINLLSSVFEAVLAIQDEDSRASALTSLTPYLPPKVRSIALSSALEAALVIQDENSRINALISLYPYLLPEVRSKVLSTALESALAIQDEDSRVNALISLIPHLPPDLLSTALEAALTIHDENSLANTLRSLAPYLLPNFLSSTLKAALAIQDEDSRANALISLAPHLSPNLLSSAFKAALAIQDEYSRANALTSLTPHLPPKVRSKALSFAIESALAIQDEDSRVNALISLAPYLLPEARSKAISSALEAALDIQHEGLRANALISLIPLLPPDLFTPALEAAMVIQDEDFIEKFLFFLIKDWKILSKPVDDDPHKALSKLLKRITKNERPKVLNMIKTLSPVIYELGGQKAVEGTVEAILEVARWWP